jgi:hypothetical protein
MTFSKPDIIKNASLNKYDWELNRFCSLLNHNVIGGANKLLSAFRKNHLGQKLYTFCDLRWGTGNVYEKMGFSYIGDSRLNYFYFGKETNWKRVHRGKFAKHVIKQKYSNIYDESKTELELTQLLGLERIYGCGHMRFELIC